MTFSLYGDVSPENIDMLALQNLEAELRKPGVTAQGAVKLTTQAAFKTGPFTINAMTESTPERQLGRAGMYIGRLRTTQLFGNQISASLQQGVDEIYAPDKWGHEAFKIAFATLPEKEVVGKFAIADRNGMDPPVHADIVVVLPSVDPLRHNNITQSCIDMGVTVIHFIRIDDRWRAVYINEDLDPHWVSSDEPVPKKDAVGIVRWYNRLCLQSKDIGAPTGDADVVPNQTANNGLDAFTSVMTRFSDWPANLTPSDARIRIIENIGSFDKRKSVEEKTDEDIAREHRDQLAKTRNEEVLKAQRIWEDGRRGAPLKRGRSTVNDEDDEHDVMDTEENWENRNEIADDSMDIDDDHHD